MPAKFKKYDPIRIIKQPSNQCVNLMDEFGLVWEVYNYYIEIRTLSFDGRIMWYGIVPADCIEISEEFRGTKVWRQAVDCPWWEKGKVVWWID